MTDLKNKVWADAWPPSNEPLTYLCYNCFGQPEVRSCSVCDKKGFLDTTDIRKRKQGDTLRELMTRKRFGMLQASREFGIPLPALSSFMRGKPPVGYETDFALLAEYISTLPDVPPDETVNEMFDIFPHLSPENVKSARDEHYIDGCMARAVRIADEATPLTAVLLLRELIRDIETKADENGNEYPGIYPYWNSIASYIKAKEFLETQP